MVIAQWLAAALMRHVPRAGCGAVLRLEQSLPLDSRRRICVISCGGTRRLLLLTGGPQDLALGWLPDEAGATETDGSAGR